MNDEFANRQNMHLTVLSVLDNSEFHAVWKDKPPVAFTTRATELRAKVDAIGTVLREQQAETAGHTADKAREEAELETLAHEIGQALAGWFDDHGRHADAVPIDLTLPQWQRLRDTALLEKAKFLHRSLTVTLGDHAASLAEHGLGAADAAALAKETADFEAIIAAPIAAISRRSAYTRALRPLFREVSDLLARMDRLILRFRRSDAGLRFVDSWHAARALRHLGGRRAGEETPAEPATPPA
jgi:hypothetical protein